MPGFDKRVLKIATDLTPRTDSGEIQWAQGRRSDQYIYSGSGASVIIESEDGDGLAPYRVVITNGSGEAVAVGDTSNDFPQEVLERLHGLAARRFLKVDETLDGLLKEIETGSPF